MFFVLILIGFALVIKVNLKNKNKPVVAINARVIGKRIDEWKGAAGAPVNRDYYIKIMSDQDERVELKTPFHHLYEKINIGEYGKFHYQNKRIFKLFIEFEKIETRKN